MRRLSVRQVKEVLRLRHGEGLSGRSVAAYVGMSHTAVQECLERARRAGIGWPPPDGLGEAALEKLLYPAVAAAVQREPDWVFVQKELTLDDMTLRLLWQEYRKDNPDGYGYSRYCELYQAWRKTHGLVMLQDHKAGEELYVDYAGTTVVIRDRDGGPGQVGNLFVAVLGASGYIYAEVTLGMGTAQWVGSHVRCFAHLGGVSALLIPDNLKAAVTKAIWYDPELNRYYAAMASHYCTTVLPARVGRARDKALVENAVQQVQRRVVAPLRDREFFSLAETNGALRLGLQTLNAAPTVKYGVSREALFREVDLPALRPLPGEAFSLWDDWKQARVHPDYHVQLGHNVYSVPYQLCGQQVDIRTTDRTVEILHDGSRVAIHQRLHQRGARSTNPEHMPAAHRAHLDCTVQNLKGRLRLIGPNCLAWADALSSSCAHEQLACRAFMGVERITRIYGATRVDCACQRALHYGLLSFRAVADILKRGLDRQPMLPEAAAALTLSHENIRGPEYYSTEQSA